MFGILHQCLWISKSHNNLLLNLFQVINADSIDIWNKEPEALKYSIKYLQYPPSFRVIIISKKANDDSLIKFRFKTEISREQFYLNLPLLQFPTKYPVHIASPSLNIPGKLI